MTKKKRKIDVWYYVFTMPALSVFLFIVIIPFIIGILYSFTDWRGAYFAGGGSMWNAWVGFANYVKVFRSDKFWSAFSYTVYYTLLAVVTNTVLGLLLALGVTKLKKYSNAFRTVYFLPNMLGGLALGFVWQIMFNEVFSTALFGENGLLPIKALTFMLNGRTSGLFALNIVTSWQYAGYIMLVYVAGLNSIPKELYEAAEVDGVNAPNVFFRITLPLLMPSFTIALFYTLSTSFKLLDQNVSLTDGAFNTRMLALQIVKTLDDRTPPEYGFAQAQSVIFFSVIAVISLLQVRFTKKRETEWV